MKKKDVIIIGAGPAGLTAAYELLKKSKDYNVIVLEETKDIGGISKTVNYNGYRMDIGGHRFFSKSKEITDFWKEIMPIQGSIPYDYEECNRNVATEDGGPNPNEEDNVMLIRNRISRIYYSNHFFDYPISLKWQTLKNLGFKKTFLSGVSYIKSVITKKEETNLENFYINRFGYELYSMFFEKYTEKLWGRHPREISADWGAQRVKGLSIAGVIKNIFKKTFHIKDKNVETSLIEEFYYPKYGPGQLWETVAKKITENGGKIILNSKVDNINFKDNKIVSVTANNIEYKGDIFISSMPLKDLINDLCGNKDVNKDIKRIANGLSYRDFVAVGILVNKLKIKNETNIKTLGNIVPDCWIYVQDESVKLLRFQIFNNWSCYLVKNPKEEVWIGAEYTCSEKDMLWKMSDKEIIYFVGKELEKIGVIDTDDIKDYHIEKIKKAYPSYFDTYEEIDKLIEYINSFDNLFCVGRNGQHRYNNMDHSMMTSIEAVNNIIENNHNKDNIWSVNTEKIYHESSDNDRKSKSKLNLLVFSIFAIVSFIISFLHEPWRDEAQSFLLSKLNFIDLFNQLKVEGHPICWYLILKLFPLKYEYIWIIPWALTLITAGLIIYKIDKPLINKILILLSLPILYVSSSFARSYCLATLITTIIGVIYKKRFEHPYLYGILLVLLMNTHVIFFGFVIGLILIDICSFIRNNKNRKNKVKSFIIAIIGIIFLVLQLYNSIGTRSDIFTDGVILQLIKSFGINLLKISNSVCTTALISSIFNVFVFLLMLKLFIDKKIDICFMIIASFCSFALINSLYTSNFYILSMFLVVLIFIYCQIENKNIYNIIVAIIFICTLSSSYFYVKNDLNNYFSTSKMTAEYIENNIEIGENLYCNDASFCEAIVPYIKDDYHFIDMTTNKEFVYVDWVNNNWSPNVISYNDRAVYIIILPQRINSYRNSYDVIYVSPSSFWTDEEYTILKKKDE